MIPNWMELISEWTRNAPKDLGAAVAAGTDPVAAGGQAAARGQAPAAALEPGPAHPVGPAPSPSQNHDQGLKTSAAMGTGILADFSTINSGSGWRTMMIN